MLHVNLLSVTAVLLNEVLSRRRCVCWTVAQSQTPEKTCGKMVERYSCDNSDGDKEAAVFVDRSTPDHHATHHASTAGRASAAERQTQIF